MRILQIGLGPLGRRVVQDLHERGLGDVVAAVDAAPEIAGKRLEELVPGTGNVPVVATLEEVADWDRIDCAIVTTSSDLELVMPTLRPLLDRGLTVLSTCEELSWPWLRHPVHAQELEERAVRGGGRVLGTGVNPGFLMDAFAVSSTMVCRSVRAIRVYRLQDASPRRIPFQRKIGVGLDDAEFERRIADGTLRHVGLGESLHFVAHYLGWKLDRWEEDIAPVKAVRALKSGLGPVPEGVACGVRQVARGWVDGALVAELVFQAAIGQEDPHDRVIVEGDPSIDLTWKGGVHGDIATSAIMLNSIRALRAAAPGLHTMSTIALPGCSRS